MGVLQDLQVRLRSLAYDRAERFIKAEDSRRREGLSERFQKRYIEFYDEHNLDERGYEGHSDDNAKMLFQAYDQFGEKGLKLAGFTDGIKLSSKDILNLLHLVEYCEVIEPLDKGLNRGIDLALKLTSEFSAKDIAGKLDRFDGNSIGYVSNLKSRLEDIEAERFQQESQNTLEEMVEDESSFEASDKAHHISEIDKTIAKAIDKCKSADTGKGMSIVQEYERE